jgi:hypothetical protein
MLLRSLWVTIGETAALSLGLGAAERRIGILQIGDERETAPMIGFAVERWTDVTRRPLQEPDAEPRFELLYGVRHRRARQVEILGREREAAPLHHPRKHPHRVKSVHIVR